ncbi:MAG TPA: hypothetical protein VFG19_10765 [Geobacteraceae bacterium]|nr:hypothetical protein [Geobacteraceae bacterium]
MGKQYKCLTEKDIGFAGRQHLFFIASACGKEVNLAPKGEDCIRFLDEKTILLLDFPGSSNRTGRDIEAGGEVTLMFCSFEEEPKVLRIFCKGDLVEKDSPRFVELVKNFPSVDPAIVRQLFRLDIYAVETSCGLSVPVMRFEKTREKGVSHWASKKESEGTLDAYIKSHKEPPALDDIG